MTVPTITYPYNPLGVKPECFIPKERGSIPASEDNDYRVVVPQLAPFFQEGLVIRHIASKKELVLGTDYVMALAIPEYKDIASKPLYGAFQIINRSLAGAIEYDYNTIGYSFVGLRSDILTYLANKMVNPVKTRFESILERPEGHFPHRHYQSYYDFVNKEDIALAIDRLTAKITASNEHNDQEIADMVSEVNELNAMLDTINFKAHTLNKNNPHGLDASKVGALGKGQSAVDTRRMNNLGLVELAKQINARGVTVDDVFELLYRDASELVRAPLTTSANIRSSAGDAKISTPSSSSSDIKLSASKGMVMNARRGS